MYISHTRSDPELSHMVKAPFAFVRASGEVVLIREWSLDAVKRPDGFTDDVARGEISLNFQGFFVSIPAQLEAGDTPDRLRLVGLDRRQAEVLRSFYHGIVSGRMDSVDDVILSMDLPVEKVPMNQTSEDRAHERKTVSRWIRGAMSVSGSILLAILVFGSLGYTFWQRSNFVETSNSRIVQRESGTIGVQTWVPDSEVTRTWIGMKGDIFANVDGQQVLIPAEVDKLVEGPEAGAGSAEGYLVSLTISEQAGLPDELVSGRPVNVRLDRDILGGLFEHLATLRAGL